MATRTWLGLSIGLGGIIIGHLIEGGHLATLVQFTAFFIVFGGTAGATVIASSAEDLKSALVRAKNLFSFKAETPKFGGLAQEIVDASQLVRKESVIALEKKLNLLSDPYMREVFRFVVDGIETKTIREVFETEIEVFQQRELRASEVWAEAGGYAPTIGILGAVLGLIHVMANLTDTSALGQGIAVAFVATIYGVGSANLIFIPISQRIKKQIEEEVELKQMILDGALSIAGGMNPYIIEQRLKSYLK